MYKVKDLYGKNYKIKRDGVWLGTEVEYFTIYVYRALNILLKF